MCFSHTYGGNILRALFSPPRDLALLRKPIPETYILNSIAVWRGVFSNIRATSSLNA